MYKFLGAETNLKNTFVSLGWEGESTHESKLSRIFTIASNNEGSITFDKHIMEGTQQYVPSTLLMSKSRTDYLTYFLLEDSIWNIHRTASNRHLLTTRAAKKHELRKSKRLHGIGTSRLRAFLLYPTCKQKLVLPTKARALTLGNRKNHRLVEGCRSRIDHLPKLLRQSYPRSTLLNTWQHVTATQQRHRHWAWDRAGAATIWGLHTCHMMLRNHNSYQRSKLEGLAWNLALGQLLVRAL